MRDKNWLKSFKGLKDVNQMFDLVVWGAYCAGSFKGKIPVEESREIFRRIKKLLK